MATETFERKLAAIVSADVVGYSRLMGADETGTLSTLKALREQRIEPKIGAYGGRIVKLMGDGILAEFLSVVEALACAVELQRDVAAQNENTPEDQKIVFRIGIHLGDILIEGNDIYGDGVNIAARLEPLAEPGCICISQAAHDAVGNKLPLDYEDMGAQHVKNIAEPVLAYQVRAPADAVMPAASSAIKRQATRSGNHRRSWLAAVVAIVAVVIGGGIVWLFYPQVLTSTPDTVAESSEASALPNKPSIAVLPFNNMSDDPEQEYFSDGITEDLITDLSKLRELVVIARNSSFAYKGKAVDVRQVGKELGVRHVLEGSVRKAGEQVRINAQLVDAATGDHVWAERYDRPLTDIFAVQDEIGQRIITSLDVALSEGDQARVWRQTTEDPAAYDLFLRGREQYLKFNPEANYQAQLALEQAVELDPDFTEAWVKLSWVHGIAASSGWSESEADSMQRSWDCVNRALELDESLGDVYARLYELYGNQGDHVRASQAIAKAVVLNPNGAKNIALFAWDLASQNRIEEALNTMQKAMRLNPNPPIWYLNVLGHIYLAAERYDEAVASFEDCAARSPEYISCAARLTIAYMATGREDDARTQAKEVLRINPKFSSSEWVKLIGPTFAEQRLSLLRQAGLPE